MNKPQALNQTRQEITSLDNDLLELLAKRRSLSLEVAKSKEVDVRPIRDTQREKELLERLVKQGREKGLDAHYVLSLYQGIIEDSVLNQQAYLHGRANPETQKQQYCIAYLGARGSYSYLAANRYCQRRQVEMLDLGCQSFDEIVHSVESGHADYGFLPIENTSSGSINEVYDVLQHTSLSIVGETTIEVGHCLLAKQGSRSNDIKTVYAHPQPISQCSRFLGLHPEFKLEYCSSSAEAMEKVLQADCHSVAAIGSAEGGALYQLEAIEKGLANQNINQSRFIVVARKSVAVPSQLPAKCTLIMATGQKPGALVEALLVLKAHDLNMSKLESRPIPGTPWEEMFYLDIDANLASDNMQAALVEIERITRFIKVLGCYPCETVKPTQLSNSQLMIEPDTSKADVTEPLQNDLEAPSQRRSAKEYKQQATEIVDRQLSIGSGNFNALAQLTLGNDVEVMGQQAKLIKEAGYQAVIIQGLNQVAEMPQKLRALCHALHQFDLVAIAKIEQQPDIGKIAPVVDMLQVCGKQMFNQDLLSLVGSLHIPVILERNTMASIDELLKSADIVLEQGNQQVLLCESGIRTFDQSAKPALDLAGIIELKRISHLPVVANLSYAVELVSFECQTQALKSLGADAIVLPVDGTATHNESGLIQGQHGKLLRQLHQN